MASVTQRLIFDPTSTSQGSNVGAYVRAGSDGDLIASQTIAAEEWLNVASALHAGDGTAITQTSGALDVNLASGAVSLGSEYLEDAAHTSGDKGQFGLGIRVDSLAAVPATALAGTELDYQGFIMGPNGELLVGGNQFDIDDLNAIDDAVQAWTFDGTGTAIGSTGGALDVNIASGFVDLDDDLANTAIENTATAVSAIAVNVVASALASRKWMFLSNEGNKSLYYGKTGVTLGTGFPLHPGMQAVARIGASVTPQIIGEASASAEDLRVMELS